MKLLCCWLWPRRWVLAGLLGAWLSVGQPAAVLGQPAAPDSLARRRAAVSGSAQARLLLDAAALLTAAPVQAQELADKALPAARRTPSPSASACSSKRLASLMRS